MNPELAKTIAQINKRAKRPMVVPASELQPIKRIPTGSLALDVVLGGGWPLNRWVELIGEESSGKTALLLKTVAENQSRNPDYETVWVAAEEYDKDWAETLGVDNSRVYLVETNIMEDAYQTVLDVLGSKGVDLIVIDSLPALTPYTEEEKNMDEPTVGRGALLTNKFFRKAMAATFRAYDGSERDVACLVVNQWREKIGVMYGDPKTTPGGKGKNYAYSIRAEVKRDEWIEVDKNKIGQTIRVKTIKNKTHPPQSSAFFDFYFADGGEVDKGEYDFGKQIVTLGKYFGVLETRGGWTYYGDRKWQGLDKVLTDIRSEVDLREELERQVLALVRHEE